MNVGLKINSIVKRIINNEYVYSVFAKVLGVALGLVYSVLYSRYLGASFRGEASIITSYASLASIVMCFGIYQAYPYYRKSYEGSPKEIYLEYINKSLGISILYMMLSFFLVIIFPLTVDKKVSLVIVPLMTGTKLLNYVVLIEHPKIRNSASVALFLVDIALVGCFTFFTDVNLFFCYALLIIKEVIYFFIAIVNLHVPPKDIRPTLKGLWPYFKYGFIPMLTVVFMEINYKIDVIMLKGRVSNADIGVYSLGVQLAERLWLIPDALKDILLSKLTKGKDAEEVAKITRISLFVMIICIGLIVVLGKIFIRILFGAEYDNAYGIMLIMLVSVIAMVFYKMIFAYNVVHGKRVINLVILGIAAILNIAINAFLIPQMGTIGAAVASLISYSACGVVFLLYFILCTDIKLPKMLFVTKSDIKQLASIIGISIGGETDGNAQKG